MNIWFLLAICLIILEILTVNLVSIWFAIGCFIAGIVSIFIDNVMIQSITFITVSIISLLLTKPFIKKLRINEIEKTNLDRVIGKIAIVTEKIDKLNPGEVKVDGKKWSAISDEKIDINKKVKILSIDGVKLKVKEEEE